MNLTTMDGGWPAQAVGHLPAAFASSIITNISLSEGV